MGVDWDMTMRCCDPTCQHGRENHKMKRFKATRQVQHSYRSNQLYGNQGTGHASSGNKSEPTAATFCYHKLCKQELPQPPRLRSACSKVLHGWEA